MTKADGKDETVKKQKGATAKRLRSILEKLATRKSYTTDMLAAAFKVSTKTILHDMEVLSHHFPLCEAPTGDPHKVAYAFDENKSMPSDVEERVAQAIAEIGQTRFSPKLGAFFKKARHSGETIKAKRGIKFDRLVLILQRLIREGSGTTDVLAQEFKVSKKTIKRDMDVLSLCFPIIEGPDKDDERKVSYSMDNESITKSRLNEDEQLALAIAKSPSTLLGAAFGKTFTAIEEKALRPATHKPGKPLLDAFVFTAPGDLSADTLQKKLLSLAEACVQGKCVRITYRRLYQEAISTRTVEPAYLFSSSDGFWYLAAFCRNAKGWRTFSVDQILEYELLEEPGGSKLSVDKQNEVAAGFGAFHGGEETKVIVRFTREIRPYIERRKWHVSETKLEVDDDLLGRGCLELRLTTTGLEGVEHWLKQWMPGIRVIEPKSLGDKLINELRLQLEYFGADC